MADALAATFVSMGKRLIQLGLGYLSLDRAATTLSTGERQRAQLARAVRNETTGVLYVLDEPSIGMHPANIEGLIGVMRDLQSGGNSVVFVDHDVQILRAADHLIELGPGAGSLGGNIVSQGSNDQRKFPTFAVFKRRSGDRHQGPAHRIRRVASARNATHPHRSRPRRENPPRGDDGGHRGQRFGQDDAHSGFTGARD